MDLLGTSLESQASPLFWSAVPISGSVNLALPYWILGAVSPVSPQSALFEESLDFMSEHRRVLFGVSIVWTEEGTADSWCQR
jgi:hypothetical protein